MSTELLEVNEPLEKKCPRCGSASANKSNPSGRCSACLKKLASNKKKVGHYLHEHKVADDALRRQKGKNGTAKKKKSGLGSRKQIIKQTHAAEKKAGQVLSPDRKDNSKGYSAKNVRMVPKELNRGRHHVDEKKLRAWKKRLKKHDIDTASLYTLMKAKYQDDLEILELLKNLTPEGLEQYIDLFDFEEPSLKKGAMKRLAPISPEQQKAYTADAKTASQWVANADSKIRENLKTLTGPARVRGFHKLSSIAQTRINPETKEREFLLHRGMSDKELEGHKLGNIKNKTSWTPHYETAMSFIPSEDSSHEEDYEPSSLISAWIPEKHVHQIPNAIGAHKQSSRAEEIGPQEHEIIVNPHNLNTVDYEPQEEVNKSKYIKSKNFNVPKNATYLSFDKPHSSMGTPENLSYDYGKDVVGLGTQGIKENEFKNFSHHEHQHRLLGNMAQQLKFKHNIDDTDPNVGKMHRADRLAQHLWDNSGISNDEAKAINTMLYHTGQWHVSPESDPHETIANIVGWMNSGPEYREKNTKTFEPKPHHMPVNEIDPHIRSAFAKIQKTLSKLKPGDSI